MLEEQIGFILRQVNQRHTTIFAEPHRRRSDADAMGGAGQARARSAPDSQNLLGRLTAMDAATIKGVVDRLTKRRLIETTLRPGGQPPPPRGSAATPGGRRRWYER